VKGNFQARFLGELGAAMPLAYPTKLSLYSIYSLKTEKNYCLEWGTVVFSSCTDYKCE
jgi:hypothetical protein